MIKITHVITGLAADGAETMLRRLVQSMNPSLFRNQVLSLTTLGDLGEEIVRSGVPVIAAGMQKNVSALSGLYRLCRLLRRSRPDVVHTWMYHADLLGGLAAKASGCRVPVVWGIHHASLDPKANTASTMWAARTCAALSRRVPTMTVCCSEASKNAHIRFGYSSERMIVIPNGFDTSKFKPSEDARREFRTRLRVEPQAPLIGLAARFHRHKDHRTFIRAAGLLAATTQEVRFVLCGRGVDWHNHELASWIRDARVESKVILLGEQTDMHGFFAGIDIGSSSSETEAFPLAVGEAMSTGTVCVVTNVGDSASIVGDTGSVVPAGDPDALAAAWKALLATGPHNLRRLGSMARRRIEAKYSLEAVARSYERAYLSARQIYLPQRCLRNRRDDRKCPSVGSI